MRVEHAKESLHAMNKNRHGLQYFWEQFINGKNAQDKISIESQITMERDNAVTVNKHSKLSSTLNAANCCMELVIVGITSTKASISFLQCYAFISTS